MKNLIEEFRSNIIIYITILIFPGIPLIIMVWLLIRGPFPNIKEPEYAIGTLSELKVTRGGIDAIITFNVKGKKYKCYTLSERYGINVYGEKFPVVYEEKKPKKCIVIRQPIFEKDELKETDSTLGRIITDVEKYVHTKNKYVLKYAVTFEYEVNGKKYKKTQFLPDNYKEKFGEIKNGDKFLVRYWKPNPARVVMYFDKPAK